MSNLKRIVVNADNFGLTSGINNGIIAGFQKGIITRTSIMASGQAFDEAVFLAKANKKLGVGLHFTLTGERPILAPDKIKSLINKDNSFYANYKIFILRYLLGLIKLKEISLELEAQINKVCKSGIKITHLDSHQNLHMLPSILSICVTMAKKYGIPSIRIPWSNEISLFNFKLLSLKFMTILSRKKISKSKLAYLRALLGLRNGGKINNTILLQYLDAIEPGKITEIMCHPGYVDKDYLDKHSFWGYDPEGELNALLSGQVKEKIKNNKIELVYC